jgi:hypothetical protein
MILAYACIIFVVCLLVGLMIDFIEGGALGTGALCALGLFAFIYAIKFFIGG